MEKTSSLLKMESLPLPAVNFTAAIDESGTKLGMVRTVRDLKSLGYMSQEVIREPSVSQFYWGADDNWYEPVNIETIRRAGLWLRFKSLDDLVVVQFELEKLDERPISARAMFRHLSYFVEKRGAHAARDALRNCSSSLEIIQWMEQYETVRVNF